MSTTTSTYRVSGMSCEHCVRAVSGEISKLPGVLDVAVDLETAAVTVTSDRPLVDVQIADAVKEAGYEIDQP
jgi:copper chaperone CopZ